MKQTGKIIKVSDEIDTRFLRIIACTKDYYNCIQILPRGYFRTSELIHKNKCTNAIILHSIVSQRQYDNIITALYYRADYINIYLPFSQSKIVFSKPYDLIRIFTNKGGNMVFEINTIEKVIKNSIPTIRVIVNTKSHKYENPKTW